MKAVAFSSYIMGDIAVLILNNFSGFPCCLVSGCIVFQAVEIGLLFTIKFCCHNFIEFFECLGFSPRLQ